MESNDEEINFNEKKEIRKTHNLCILLSFLLIAIVLLIAVSINYYLIKYQRNNLSLFYSTNN